MEAGVINKRIGKCSNLGFVIACIIFALSIFPMSISLFPVGMNRLVSFTGGFYLLTSYSFYKNRFLKKILKLYFLLIYLAVIASLLNSNFDYQYCLYILNPILSIGTGLIICKIMGRRIEFHHIIDLVVVVQCAQALISFIMFFDPSIRELMQQFIISINEDDIQLGDYRLIGLGSAYISAAYQYGVSLLFLVLLPYIPGSSIYKRKYLYISFIFLISLAGVFSARTFMFVGVSVLFFLFRVKKHFIRRLIGMLKYIVVILFAYMAISSLFRDYLDFDRYEHMMSWAFEMFNNYSESGQFETSSSDNVVEMYTILPKTIGTWLIGDAKFSLPDNKFYMNTDIGFSRQIFYWGLIGLFSYWLAMLRYYKLLSNNFKNHAVSMFLVGMFIFEIVLQFKGILNFSAYLGLLLAYYSYKMKNKSGVLI